MMTQVMIFGSITCAALVALLIYRRYNTVYIAESNIEQMVCDVLRTLYTNTGNHDYHYSIPWTLIIGPPSGNKRYIVDSSDSNYTAKDGDDIICSTDIHPNGVVIKVSGKTMTMTGKDSKYQHYWIRLIEALAKHRPNKPIDSIVLAWPYKSFQDSSYTELRSTVSSQITYLQAQFSMRVFMYVIITGCEEMPGFSALCKALPKSELNKPFGWSAADAVKNYTSEWIPNSINYMINKVRILSDAVMATEHDAQTELIKINRSFKAMQQKWHDTMSDVLKFQPLNILPCVRGVYFSGIQHNENGKEVALFCKELFRDKILVEKGVTQSGYTKLSRANKALYHASWIASSLLIIASIYSVTKARRDCKNYAEQLEKKLPKLVHLELNLSESNLEYTICTISEIQSSVPRLVRYIDSILTKKLDACYNRIYCQILKIAFNKVQSKFIDDVMTNTTISSDGIINLDDAIADLVYFVNAVNKAEGTLVQLLSNNTELLKDSLYDALPEIENITHLVDTLGSPDLDLSIEQVINRKAIIDLWIRFENHIYDALSVEFIPQIHELYTSLLEMSEYPEICNKAFLVNVAHGIANLIADLKSSKLNWLCKGRLSANDQVDDAIQIVNKSQLLGAGIANQFVLLCDAKTLELQNYLASDSRIIPGVKRLFTYNDDATIAITTELRNYLGLLNLTLSQGFMNVHLEEQLHDLNAWKLQHALLWNIEELSQIVLYIKNHERFVAKLLPKFTNDIGKAIHIALCLELLKVIKSKLYNAEILQVTNLSNEEYFKRVARNAQDTSEYMLLTTQYIHKIGFEKVAIGLAQEVTSHIKDVLSALKAFLDDNNAIYDIKWLATQCLAGGIDNDRLRLILAQSFNQLEYIAINLAEPILNLFTMYQKLYPTYIIDSAIILFWRQMIQDTKSYKVSRTGALLFIDEMMMKLNSGAYKQSKPLSSGVSNTYVQDKVTQFNQAINYHIGNKLKEEAMMHYKPLIAFFRKHSVARLFHDNYINVNYQHRHILNQFCKIYYIKRKKLAPLLNHHHFPAKEKKNMVQFLRLIDRKIKSMR